MGGEHECVHPQVWLVREAPVPEPLSESTAASAPSGHFDGSVIREKAKQAVPRGGSHAAHPPQTLSEPIRVERGRFRAADGRTAPRLDPARVRRRHSALQLRRVHGHGTHNLGARRLAPLDRRSWKKGADEQARTGLARRGRDAGDQGRRRAPGQRRVLRHRRLSGARGASDYRGLREVRHTQPRSPNRPQSPDRAASVAIAVSRMPSLKPAKALRDVVNE